MSRSTRNGSDSDAADVSSCPFAADIPTDHRVWAAARRGGLNRLMAGMDGLACPRRLRRGLTTHGRRKKAAQRAGDDRARQTR